MNLKKFLLSLGVLLCCAGASHAQIESPDVPLDDSAYADIYILWQQELVEGYSPPMRARAQTRYEFAVPIARLFDAQLNLRQDKDGTFKPTAPLPATSNLNKPEVMAALKRLTNKFLPELDLLGFDARQIKIDGAFLIEPKIAPLKIKVAPPFSDVPKNHWAFAAVEKLRLGGIVIGVSTGKTAQLNAPTSPNAPTPPAASGRGSVRR